MTETLYAVVTDGGVVENLIVADAEGVAELRKRIADPDTDSGPYDEGHRFYDVTDKDPRPDIGWTRSKNGKYAAPVPPELTEDEIAAREAAGAAAAQRADDDAFLEDIAVRLAEGGSLDQDERDRKDVILARRA